jgi:pimeloyl-ACP methyl ester carboxylesterase
VDTRNGSSRWALPFLAGVAAGTAGLTLLRAFERKRLDPLLLRGALGEGPVPPVVVVPGIMGSCLLRPDGTPVWLNLHNALGHYDLSLPFTLPLSECRDDLVPGPLLGTEAVMPRLFGFTEYADLVEILERAGFHAAGRNEAVDPDRPTYHVFGYDWRRDLVESARRLHETLESLAEARGEADARFNVIGHSMGGLVARYYLRYGTAEPEEGAPVTWAGARRIRNLILVAVPNGGAIHALEALLYGNRVGLSYTTLAAGVIARMPSVYQLLPPAGTRALVDHELEPLQADLHDIATWERFGWGPFAPAVVRRLSGADGDSQAHRPFLEAALLRARAFHAAMGRPPESPCPVRVVLLGGDCLPTLARAVVPQKSGLPPRFEPWNRKETEALFEAGDGRLTRASVLAQHLPRAEEDESGCGLPEVAHAVFGNADHHGIYREPTFQSIMLRLLMRPSGPGRRTATPSGQETATAVADPAIESGREPESEPAVVPPAARVVGPRP